MTMTTLALVLVLGAPLDARSNVDRSVGETACSVRVFALDPDGQRLTTQAASGSQTPAMVFHGRAVRVPEGRPPLLFDVFNPRGQRYQVVLGATRGRSFVPQSGMRRPAAAAEATLAVAGSSIAWTSMYGRWRVEPRFEGQDRPCGPARFFTILP